ncbi:hypothetical protein KQI84_04525 [bacterium]|nr:hypothetical protein [bacterium]
MDLPEKWQFLGLFWWILHVFAIGLVFFLGFMIGRVSAEKPDGEKNDEEW